MGALPVIISLLSQMLTLVPAGTALWTSIKANKDKAHAMEGRDPTQAEWDALHASIQANTNAIDAGAARP